MKSLVGYTGFVGSNLAMSTHFDETYNRSNIKEAFGTNPDLLVYAGVVAQKFMANKSPEKDMEIIQEAVDNIKKINPKRLVLISTIDVYENPVDVDENTTIDPNASCAYGKNRFYLEKWVQDNHKDYLIVRLPALFGRNIKKNFVYDLIHLLPSLLTDTKFKELSAKESILKDFYKKQDNGFYKLCVDNPADEEKLKDAFRRLDFSALNFTDSRATYQFYNLKNLWSHIEIALKNKVSLLCPATEPISARELYRYITDEDFDNKLDGTVAHYNCKSIHYGLYGGKNGYLQSKKQVLKDLKDFIKQEQGLKLSASNLGWNIENDEEVLSELKTLGFRGLEIAPSKLFGETPYAESSKAEEYAKLIRTDYGLSICSMQSIWYKRSENLFVSAEDRQKLLDYTLEAIDFAAYIGCKNLIFGCPKNRNIPNKFNRDKAKALFVSWLKSINEHASKKGVYLLLEANPKIYNTNFLNSTSDTAQLLKELDLSNIGLNLDFGTIVQSKEKLDELEQYLSLVKHVHISEPFLEKPRRRKNHKKLAEVLKKNHYSGFVSLEMKELNSITEVKETLQYIKEIFL